MDLIPRWKQAERHLLLLFAAAFALQSLPLQSSLVTSFPCFQIYSAIVFGRRTLHSIQKLTHTIPSTHDNEGVDHVKSNGMHKRHQTAVLFPLSPFLLILRFKLPIQTRKSDRSSIAVFPTPHIKPNQTPTPVGRNAAVDESALARSRLCCSQRTAQSDARFGLQGFKKAFVGRARERLPDSSRWSRAR